MNGTGPDLGGVRRGKIGSFMGRMILLAGMDPTTLTRNLKPLLVTAMTQAIDACSRSH